MKSFINTKSVAVAFFAFAMVLGLALQPAFALEVSSNTSGEVNATSTNPGSLPPGPVLLPPNIFFESLFPVENTDALCHDGIDNNGNFLIDASDPSCTAFFPIVVAPVENTDALCHDGIDNNGNFLVDASDPSCSAFFPVENTDALCHDGIDNNGNFLVDASDPSCSPFFSVSTSTGSIGGIKFNDQNGNGSNNEEPTLSGWVIHRISGSEAVTDISTTTNGNSGYTFSNLANGTYTICEEPQTGWIQTYPTASTSGSVSCTNGSRGYEVIISEGETHSNIDFGNVRGATINVFKKTNPETINKSFDFTLTKGGSVLGTTSANATVDTGGSFTNLLPGSYILSENLADGWDFNGVSCRYEGEDSGTSVARGEQISVDSGDVVDCTFANTQSTSTPATSTPPAPTPAPKPSSDFAPQSGGSGGGGSNFFSTLPSGPAVLGASTTDNSSGPTCSVPLVQYMRIGKKNDPSQVRLLQNFLNSFLGLNLPVTGFFGIKTDAAVKQLQFKYTKEILQPWVDAGVATDLTPTGYVYKTTSWFINSKTCASTPFPKLP